MKEIMEAISENYENETGERSFELDRACNNHGESEEDILDLLASLGY